MKKLDRKTPSRSAKRLSLRILRVLRDAWAIMGIAFLLFLVLDTIIYLSFRDSVDDWVQVAEITTLPDAKDDIQAIGAEFLETHGSPWKPQTLRWQPFVYWRSKPYEGKWTSIDPSGLRRTAIASGSPVDPNFAQQRPIRIFCFGGSTMWGTAARDLHTIPSELTAIFRESGINVEITNFGQPGYTSTQELIALNLELQSGNIPDIVVFYDGFNDIGATLGNGRPGLAGDEFNRRSQEDLLRRNSIVDDSWSLFVAHSSISRLFRPSPEEQLAKQMSETYRSGDPALLAKSIVQCYVANMKLADAICSAYSIPVVFFWQPLVFSKAIPGPNERVMVNEHPTTAEFYQTVYGVVQNLVLDYAEDPLLSKLHYIGDTFDATEYVETDFFWDHCHVSEAGNSVIADRMASHLFPIIKSLSGPVQDLNYTTQ